MAIFIIGHGVQESGDPATGLPDWTVVPANGSVTFFTESGSNLLMANGLAALEANSRANGYTYPAGSPIENYRLSRLADDERQLFETVQGNSDTLAGALYVGEGALLDGVRLCASSDCHDGQHQCGGILHRFPGPIIVLACRGDGVSSTGQVSFGTTDSSALSEKYGTDLAWLASVSWFAKGSWLYDLASYDPNNPNADAQVEAAYLLTSEPLSAALDKFNTFCDYFRELQSDDFTHVWPYIEMYDSLAPMDQYTVGEWDRRVAAAVESVRHTPTDEELLGNLDALLGSPPADTSQNPDV